MSEAREKSMVSSRKERSIAPDVMKAIAIIMVVWGHLIQTLYGDIASVNDTTIFRIIYSVHMPLFMLVSGYFFYSTNNKTGFLSMCKKRAKAFLIPIVIWNICYYAIVLLLSVILRKAETFSFVKLAEEITQGLWFLWAILFYSIAMSLAHCLKNVTLRVVCYFLFTALFFVSPCRWPIITMYPFYLIGYGYHHFKEKKKVDLKSGLWIALTSFAVYAACLFLYFRMDWIGNSLVKDVLEAAIAVTKGGTISDLTVSVYRLGLLYLMGCSGSVFIAIITWIICRKAEGNGFVKKFATIGVYSLQIYILQRIILELIIKRLYRTLWQPDLEALLLDHVLAVSGIIALVLSVLLCIVIAWFSNCMKENGVFKFLFGR